jgi:hypothetical protein
VTKIVQMMPPSNPMNIRFDKFQVDSMPLLVPVEFIAIVDYDGQTEIEYAGILDGQMLLFNVDGNEILLERWSPPIMQFQTIWNREEKKKKAKDGYGL